MSHGLVTFPRRILPWIEPWFLAYTCLGMVQGGMLPMLLPLTAGGTAHAGVIVGAVNLTGLTAPFWGHLADRRRLHRQVLLIGLLMVLAALLLMPAQFGLPVKTALAGLLGVGLAAANTVANMFIVEVRPKEEWDARIGALQALGGIGQVAGLLLAGLLGSHYDVAFGVSAGLIAAACPIAWMTLRRIQVPVARAAATGHPVMGGEAWTSGPQRLFHVVSWHGLLTLVRRMEVPFARLLVVWFAAFAATSATLATFPLSLIQAFGVSPRLPADTYAFAVGGSLLFYPLAASLAKRHGPRRVLRVGLAVRAAAGAILGIAFLSQASDVTLALVGFVAMSLAWPLLGVSSTALAAQLATGEKGEALGLFNAVSCLAGAVGAVLGGLAAAAFGYGTVCLAAAIVVALAALVSGVGDAHGQAVTASRSSS